jgi:hypothetical protein
MEPKLFAICDLRANEYTAYIDVRGVQKISKIRVPVRRGGGPALVVVIAV